ncbi:putative cell differentiation protein RCD1 -like protein [Capsicum annuum]|nr:putative cell differentiation protein RCD1 -like protein [Capsicum annuum]
MRLHEQTARVKSSMKENKILEVFIQVKDDIYYQHLLSALGKPFIEVLKIGEMVEDGIKTGRIVNFATLKATTQATQKDSGNVGRKKNEEDVAAIVAGQQERSIRPRRRYPQAQTQVYAQALQNHSQNPLYFIPLSPYPDHSIEDCRSLKREIEKMIQDKSVMLQNIDSGENSSHANMQTSG